MRYISMSKIPKSVFKKRPGRVSPLKVFYHFKKLNIINSKNKVKRCKSLVYKYFHVTTFVKKPRFIKCIFTPRPLIRRGTARVNVRGVYYHMKRKGIIDSYNRVVKAHKFVYKYFRKRGIVPQPYFTSAFMNSLKPRTIKNWMYMDELISKVLYYSTWAIVLYGSAVIFWSFPLLGWLAVASRCTVDLSFSVFVYCMFLWLSLPCYHTFSTFYKNRYVVLIFLWYCAIIYNFFIFPYYH